MPPAGSKLIKTPTASNKQAAATAPPVDDDFAFDDDLLLDESDLEPEV
jgi:hypothetical protein